MKYLSSYTYTFVLSGWDITKMQMNSCCISGATNMCTYIDNVTSGYATSCWTKQHLLVPIIVVLKFQFLGII